MRKYHFSKKGFTLVELLVAATIIGILAVFATSAYRNSVAETRFTQAKALALQLANAVIRARIDYPNVKFSANDMSNPTSMTGCTITPVSTTVYPFELVRCGYLERAAWTNEYFSYYICDDKTKAGCQRKFGTTTEYPVACVQVKADSKLPADYKGYMYCIYERGGEVEYTS